MTQITGEGVAVCGNNKVDAGEACDGSDLNNYTCATVAAGFVSGTLTCKPDCSAYEVSNCVKGNTINAVNCSQEAVQAAINSAHDGDIVNVPAGNCNWPTPVCISGTNYCTPVYIAKSIVLKGAGIDKTNITSPLPQTWQNIVMVVDNQGIRPVRITGFTFTGSTTITIELSDVRNFRVDHCRFNYANSASIAVGSSHGVIDHCAFINSNIGIRISGDNDASWNRPIIPGTYDAVFVEDSIFIAEQDGDPRDCEALNEQIYHDSWGARSTVRNNVFNGSACDKDFAPFEAHGNWPNDPYTARGVVMVEAYNNIFDAYKTYRFMHFRGGSLLIFNNTMTYESDGRPAAIALTDENDWQTAFFNPLDTTWSAQDQVFNSFFWDNTLTLYGQPKQPVTESDVRLWNANDPPFIQKDRDYWMHAPNSTGGRTEWIDPANPGADNNEVLVAGANAYYPYTPYVYPHPLSLIDATSAETHASDTDQDGCVELSEMVAFMNRWKLSVADVTMPEMMESIGLWKGGTGC